MSNNSPKKHHYIPRFYTASWAKEKHGKIVEYKKLGGGRPVVHQFVFPTQTGFMDRLYELRDLPEGAKQKMETIFFSPLDNNAATAVRLLSEGHAISSEHRLALHRFRTSLMLRCPEDVRFARLNYLDRFSRMVADLSESADPLKRAAGQLAAVSRELSDNAYFDVYTNAILGTSSPIDRFIYAMDWHTIDTSNAKRKLITSDRPTLLLPTASPKRTTNALPIGPSKIAVTTHDNIDVEFLRGMDASHLVDICNSLVVKQASKLVFAQDTAETHFIVNNLGLTPQRRVFGPPSARKA